MREWIRTERRPTFVVAALVLVCVLWFAFVGGRRVPILGFVDLAVHEAGHVLFLWAPTDVMLAMGNGFQALVPLVLAGAFALRHRDLAGCAASLSWCAAALQDASVYIADAPYRRLPLLGPESSHDWWQLLGRHGWLGAADELSRVVWTVGLLAWLLSVAVLVVGLRWDREWLDGDEGTLYLPWDRERSPGPRITGALVERPLGRPPPVEPPRVEQPLGRPPLGRPPLGEPPVTAVPALDRSPSPGTGGHHPPRVPPPPLSAELPGVPPDASPARGEGPGRAPARPAPPVAPPSSPGGARASGGRANVSGGDGGRNRA